MEHEAKLEGPILSDGVAAADVPDGGTLLGQVAGEAVLLARRGPELFAVSATCTHYGGPLAEGILVGHEVRCPWHHACFDLRTGAAVGPPALSPLPCWRVEREGDRVLVREKQPRPEPPPLPAEGLPASVVIVGAGAAGNAAAETLRAEGYRGPVTLVGAEPTVPVDRPNLSKDYLAGTAPEEWIPLRGRAFYAERRIDLRVGRTATALDLAARAVTLDDGTSLPFGALLLAPGAEPRRPAIPGAERPHVFTLRTLEDSRAIIAAAIASPSRRAAVLGSSFIGLEAAAALRARGLEVDVISPDHVPLARALGPELGAFVREVHEAHGVRFHLGTTPRRIGDGTVELENGAVLLAELVVAGVGVTPRTQLAEAAGLRVDRGILVDALLETSAPGVFAAGDAARHPDAHGGDRPIRVEHWAVAERMGQTAARNILGRREPYRHVPFFWSQHHDLTIGYVGHAEGWDAVDVAGSIADRDCLVAYREAGRIAAVATIGRDRQSLLAEEALARDDQPALERLLA